MLNPTVRLLLCSVCLALWLACLLLGLLPALGSHLFLLIAIVLWPRKRQPDRVIDDPALDARDESRQE